MVHTYQGGRAIFNQLLDIYPRFVGEAFVHNSESKAITTLKATKRLHIKPLNLLVNSIVKVSAPANV